LVYRRRCAVLDIGAGGHGNGDVALFRQTESAVDIRAKRGLENQRAAPRRDRSLKSSRSTFPGKRRPRAGVT
jgi:hypothetical protein